MTSLVYLPIERAAHFFNLLKAPISKAILNFQKYDGLEKSSLKINGLGQNPSNQC